MVASEHPEAIEERGQLISAQVPDHEEAAGGGSIDDYNYASDEQDESGLRLPGVSTGVTEVGKKYLEGVQQAVKYSSLSSYMLKPLSLFPQGFKYNQKAHEKPFNTMFNFGA